MPHQRPAALARYLALAWSALILYGSLHPFSGWRDTGSSPFAFLEGGWPRYWTGFDIATNVAVYAPLGFFLTLALGRLSHRVLAVLIALACGAFLSFSLEAIQTWLPARVPSNLDLAANTLGTLLGSLLALLAGRHFIPRMQSLGDRLFLDNPATDPALTLLSLWLLIPLSPEILLFGAGDLRHTLELLPAVPFAADSFPLIEAGVIALNTLAVGLLVRQVASRTSTALLLVPTMLLLGLVSRMLAAVILVGPQAALVWLTPGAQQGVLAGGLALAIGIFLPGWLRLVLIALALMAATVLVNLAPPNPYSSAALAAWQQGHFLNFNGLTRLVSAVWPFLTLAYVVSAGRPGKGG